MKTCLLFPALLLLGGCLSQSDPAHIYILNAPKTSPAAQQVARDLEVVAPTAAPGLSTDRIALKHSPTSFDYYADSRWPSPLPEMVQATIVKTLEQQAVATSVTNDEIPTAADDILSISIQDFQAEYMGNDAAPVVHVTLSAKLSDAATQKVFGTFISTSSVKAGANSMEQIVAAFDESFQKSLLDLSNHVAALLAQKPSVGSTDTLQNK
ncbi:MAG: ABC-type transport auxiliary lipoprotein family protein [Rickettsiales bacterium]